MLEPVGLVVHLVDVDAERLARGTARAAGGGGSPRARPARRRASARRRDRARARRASSAASFFTIALAEAGETPISRARRGRRDAVAGRSELVDPAQVVLDRVAQRRHPRHPCECRGIPASGSAGRGSPTAQRLPRRCRALIRSRPSGRPSRPQPGPRRRVHVLGADDGSRRHAGIPLRAGARGHPDAEPVGARRAARGDGDLARRVSVRPGGLRPAAARRLDRRRATGRSSSRASRWRSRSCGRSRSWSPAR